MHSRVSRQAAAGGPTAPRPLCALRAPAAPPRLADPAYPGHSWVEKVKAPKEGP